MLILTYFPIYTPLNILIDVLKTYQHGESFRKFICKWQNFEPVCCPAFLRQITEIYKHQTRMIRYEEAVVDYFIHPIT